MNNEINPINPEIQEVHKNKDGKVVVSLPVEIDVPESEYLEKKDNQTHDLHKVQNNSSADLTKEKQDQNYVEAFIHNKLVSKVFPDMMNWLNIGGNSVSLIAHAFNMGEGAKKASKILASFSTKSFMVATSVINIVERCYSKNFVSALGFLNDILIAGAVGQEDTYLARGTASGTYNLGNSLADSVGKKSFDSIDDHIASTFKALKKFFGNFFSKDIVKNFKNHENGMWAIFGGLGSNIGALTWMLTGETKISTLIRDVCGALMDIEQLNPGHLKAGRSNFFWSGVSLGIGTASDLVMRFVPQYYKDLLVPMTFVFDGLGRHLLRLDRNERELKEESIPEKKEQVLKSSVELSKAVDPLDSIYRESQNYEVAA